jgi:hypothetical protein
VIRLLAVVLFAVLVTTTTTSQAALRSVSYYNKSTCSGSRITSAMGDLRVDDQGSRVYVRSGTTAGIHYSSCDSRVDYTADLELQWTITASGWAVDGCNQLSIPAGFTCQAGYSSQTWTYSTQGRGSWLLRSIGGDSLLWFPDAAVGDISKVCARVDAWSNGVWRTAASGCVAAE